MTDRIGRSARSNSRRLRLPGLLLAALLAGGGTAGAAVTAPPVITSHPANPSRSASATFAFTGPAGASFACSLDNVRFTACTSPKRYARLREGAHRFRVQARLGGRRSTATFRWRVLPTPPPPIIRTAPGNAATETEATFTFTHVRRGSTFVCSLDASPFTACASPQTYTGLAPGVHAFAVKATYAGRQSTPARHVWWIVAAPPPPVITSAPDDPSTSASATFAFSDSEPGVSFLCALDGSAFTPCSSPQTYTRLTAGVHTFRVTASRGGVPSTSAVYTWRVRLGGGSGSPAPPPPPPTTLATKPPAVSTSSTATFELAAPPPGTSYVCQLDGGAFLPCSGSVTFDDLANGSHQFAVASVDAAGNQSASMTWTWAVVPPGAARIVLAGSTADLPSGTTRTLTATIVDAAGNTISSGADSTLTLSFAQTGGTGSLTAPATATAVGGVATITVAGVRAGPVSVTVSATLSGPGATASSPLGLTVVAGAAARLVFVTPPRTTAAGWLATMTVQRQDAAGNPATAGPLTIGLTGTAPSGAFRDTADVLDITQLTLADGESSGSFLYRDTVAGTPTLTAHAAALSGAAQLVTITPAAPALVWVTNDSDQSAQVATAFASPLQAIVTDAYGNGVPGVTVTWTAPAAGASGTFADTSTATTTATTGAAGVATASVLTAGTVAGRYDVVASAPGLASARSHETNLPGPARTLAWLQQPTGAELGVAISPAPSLQLVDAYGNAVPDADTQVTIAVASGPGSLTAGSTATVRTTASGIASFPDLALDTAGAYTFEATSPGLVSSPPSAGFTISGQSLTVGGDADGLLYPGGATHTIAVTIANPNAAPVAVAALTVAVAAGTLPSGCPASAFAIQQVDLSTAAPTSGRIVVPAGGSVTLPAQGVAAPTIRMLDDGNQDACAGQSFELAYTGATDRGAAFTGTGRADVGGPSPFSVDIGSATYEAPNDPTYHPSSLLPTARDDANAVLAAVPVTVTNTGAGYQYLHQLRYEITPGWTASLGGHPDCTAADFSVNGGAAGAASTVVYDEELAPGAGVTRTFTVQMIDTGRDQDACIGAKPSITVSGS